MGYLAKFSEDVFISYATLDDDDYGGVERSGWVSQLHQDLKKRVAGRLGAKDPSLWRDNDISNNEDFERKISKRLAGTATLLSVMSPGFFKRPWCIREIREFASHAASTLGLRISGEKSRIFKVEKLPVNRDTFPEEVREVLQGIGSYKFYAEDPEHPGTFLEFRPLMGTDHFRNYLMAVNELAEDIAKVLQEMAGMDQATLPTVYIAETSSDLAATAREIRRDLKTRGYQVLPPGDLPHEAADFRQKVREYLSKSVMSVHLIGKEYGRAPEKEEKSCAWLQNELAMEREAGAGFVRLVWMPAGLQPADPKQQKFVDQVLNCSGRKTFTDVRQETVEEFKGVVEAKLREIQDNLKRRSAGNNAVSRSAAPGISATGNALSGQATGEPLRIYIICDQLDRKSAHLVALKKFLFEQGYEAFLPLEAGSDEREAIQAHTDSLEICDACLIYYGAGSERWFETKIADFRKILSRRARPVLAKAIYVAPPLDTSKDGLLIREAMIQRASENFFPQDIAEFLAQLHEEQGKRRPS